MAIQKLIAGNWKMNGLIADGKERAQQLVKSIDGMENAGFEMLLCPPVTLLSAVADIVANSGIVVGGQDCHAEKAGAYTGNISAEMLKDIGCGYVIVGHSERRQIHGEKSDEISAKAAAAHAAGLKAIICVGETDQERESGKANDIVMQQIEESFPASATAENTVLAYEPVWAIGTGKVASTDDIKAMHALMRTKVSAQVQGGAGLRLLYGGSVKPGNAGDVMSLANVDGVLVGGASLKVEDFCAIAQACVESKAA